MTFVQEKIVLRKDFTQFAYNLESCNAFPIQRVKVGEERERDYSGDIQSTSLHAPKRTAYASPSSRSPNSKPFVLHSHFLFLYTKLGRYSLQHLLGFDCYIISKLPFVS